MTTSKRYHTNTSYEKQQLRYFLLFVIEKYDIRCFFCGEKITADDIPARGNLQITEHHKDRNRLNWAMSNRWLAHRKCHKQEHVRDNIQRGR